MTAQTQTVRIDRYSKGLITRGINPFSFPQDALSEAINVRLADGGVKCRPGSSAIGELAGVAGGASDILFHLGFNGDLVDDIGNLECYLDGNGEDSFSLDTSEHYEGTGSLKIGYVSGKTYGGLWYENIPQASVDLGAGDPDANWIVEAYMKLGANTVYDIWLASVQGSGKAGWTFKYHRDLSNQSTLYLAIWDPGPAFVVQYTTPGFALTLDTWWRIQLQRLDGVYYFKADPADAWNGTVRGQVTSSQIPPWETGVYWNAPKNNGSQAGAEAWIDSISLGTGGETLSVSIRGLWQIRFPSSEASYLLAQTEDTEGTNKLQVCADPLPETDLEFTEIYDLGVGAGLCEVAVLGDRAVITEGKNHPPLVFPGGLAEDGSDWAAPKTVLISYNGGADAKYEDITQAVCDTDLDSSAQIGGMLLAGEILIICDVPKVKAFLFEMESANQGSGDGTQEFSETTAIDSLTKFQTLDLGAGLITQWVQDDDLLGHFEGEPVILTEGSGVTDEGSGKVGLPCTSSPFTGGEIIEIRGSSTNYNGTRTIDASSTATKIVIAATYSAYTVGPDETATQRITLGAGNACPDIEAGLAVNFSDATVNILQITDDGEADEEVKLETARQSGAVGTVTGIELIASGMRLAYGNSDQSEDIYSKSLTAGSGNYAAWSFRVLVKGSDLLASGSNAVLKTRVGEYSATASHMSIVPQGTGPSGNATPTEILTGGQSGWFGAPGELVEHDPITEFVIEAGTTYVVIYDMAYTTTTVRQVTTYGWIDNPAYTTWANSRPQPYTPTNAEEQAATDRWAQSAPPRKIKPADTVAYIAQLTGALATGSNAGGYYYKNNPGADEDDISDDIEVTSWNQQTVSGFTLVAGYTVGLESISASTVDGVVPTQGVVACTTNASRLNVGHIESIVQVSETGSSIGTKYRAVSFDQLQTLRVFKSEAWREIVKFDSVWKCLDGSDDWQSAAINSLLGAWRQAAAITANQMSAVELQGITKEQWQAENGFVPHVNTTFDVAVYLQVSAGNIPLVTSWAVKYSDKGSAILDGWQNGGWVQGDGWTDDTQGITGVPLSQDGVISHNGGEFVADYGIHNDIHGYAYRLRTQGTSAQTAITRIRYQAACQPLATIAANIPDPPLAFIVVNGTDGTQRDYAVEMSDNLENELSQAVLALDTDDEIAIVGLTKFTAVQLTPLVSNANLSRLLAYYWDGTTRKALTVVDGTTLNDKCCAAKGLITFAMPSDWKSCVPYANKSERGYVLWLKVSAALSSTTSVAECRIYSVPAARPKYRHALTVQNRLAFGDRSDQRAQWDIGRTLEEFGFCGTNSRADGASQDNQGGVIAGAGGAIMGAIEAWGSLFSFGADEMWQLLGNYPSEWYFGRVEATGLIPINSRVCVKAPMSSNDGDRYALYMLNQRGAYAISGLQADNTFGAARVQELSEMSNLWRQDHDGYRLDLDYLHLACGAPWHPENQVLWSVPVILPSNSSQTTNNALLVWNRALGAWEGLWIFPQGFSCLCVAFESSVSIPGNIGPLELLAGGYDGKIYRLMSASDDDGVDIDWSVQGWLASARIVQRLSDLTVFGYCATNPVQFKLWRDGDQTEITEETKELSDIIAPTGKDFWREKRRPNLEGEIFKYELSGSGPTELIGLEFGLEVERDTFA